MESLRGHSWRQYVATGEHHQVLDPPHVTDAGMVWAACGGGGVHDLWASEPDRDGEKRCVSCLVLVGALLTARRAHRITETQSQTPAAFQALNTDGPATRAFSTRLDQPPQLC
ncbi:hypothetical protein AB0425_17245 [Actinosynnema sp. NPDC051121]